ncbi:hypothetical protein AHF37_09284 [Paragonimus kellicotti]|nr:hypothetical protein AHF37_09284 [Paragonimus kellicotti]
MSWSTDEVKTKPICNIPIAYYDFGRDWLHTSVPLIQFLKTECTFRSARPTRGRPYTSLGVYWICALEKMVEDSVVCSAYSFFTEPEEYEFQAEVHTPTEVSKEHNKLAQQICRAYGANRKYPRPASLHLVNYQPDGPIAKACMDKCDGFESYFGKSLNEANSKKCRALRLPVCEFAEKHGAAKPKNPVLAINQVVDIVLRYLNNGQNWSEALSVMGKHCSSPHELFGEYKEIVYLSPDADDPLLSMSDGCVYVIGGLVDEHMMRASFCHSN